MGACRLTWEFIYPEEAYTDLNWYLPRAVKLLAEYDVRDHSNPNTLPFQYGMRMRETDPATEEGMRLWERLFKGDSTLFDEILNQGRIILKYQKQVDARYCARYAYPVTFEGYKAIALNRGFTSSRAFEHAPGAKDADLFITFVYNGSNWVVTLYANSPDVDVGEIAKKYGGGGHKGAAGFLCIHLPFHHAKKDV